MSPKVIGVLWVVLMAGVIVAVDLLFLRGSVDTMPRLLVNIGIVVVFAGLYFLLFRRHRS